jgi:NADH-quinone oxidoreductase subunit J
MSLRAQNKTVSNPYLPTDSNFLVTPPEPRLIDLVSPTAVYFIVTTLLVSSVLVPSIGFLSSTLNFIVLSLSNSSWSFVFEFLLPFLACVFASLVFLVRNPMHALLSLVGVFFSTVLFYVGAGIEFIGLVFLIVYVGAVAVLFLFVIMLLNVKSLTSSERLIRHASQVIAIAAGIILFCQLKTRVIGAASVALLQSHAASPNISSTAADAVIFYVRYRASDINALTPLYTQHSPLFMIITIILLVALLGAIIMATITTEKPTVVADICVAPVTDARLTFQRLSAPKFTAAVAMFALCFTAAHDDLLPCAAFIFGWFKKRTPVRVTMQSPRVRA